MQCLSMIAGQLAWGDSPLLDKADFAMEAGERVGLIGRNGTGKSSFMKVLAGQEMLDGGTLQRLEGQRAVYVEQEPAIPEAGTLLEAMIARGSPAFAEDERAYWQEIARLEEYFHKFSLRAEADPAKASGGEKKRAALALALSLQPDLLLLDEPTNHLDVEAIEALERMLLADYRNSRSLVVVTHDRAFLDAVATRIVELDRGALRSYPGNFTAYEERKAKELEDEQLANQRFDKFLSQEEVWIRKGIEARRTRNEGRVRRLERLRVLRQQRRERIGRLDIKVDDGGRSGKVVAELTGVSKSLGGRQIVKGLDFTLMRGDKLGLIGRNGAGKS
ncbi:MAG: ATP-binding cassette domain-containing protein, partial [Duodenibacillus sp.]|nr:ATP-binding cassette domain-containing protein [Duodenibacillus sp.]